MNTHLLALQLMALQGCLGAFDTIYHHEITEALAQRQTARLELSIHAVRALIYAVLFMGLSAWTWNGIWAVVLVSLFTIEILLTLWDFVTEDKTRLLPATERVTHTILAINGGAFVVLLLINANDWFQAPSAFAWQPYGLLSVFLFLCGIGVGLSGLRDAFAALTIGKRSEKDLQRPAIQFSASPQQVLITGATGFIGQQLVQALLRDHQNVTILTRRAKYAAWLFDGRVRCVSDLKELPNSYQIDIVINLAGARILGSRWTGKRKALLRRSRVDLTAGLVDWIKHTQHKPRLLLSASAIGYYGVQKQDDNAALTEQAPAQPIFMSALCQEWEAAANAASIYGVSVACMRFGLVLGHQGALPMMLLPVHLGVGGRLGTGRQCISWIHMHDLIRAMAHLWRLSDRQNNEKKNAGDEPPTAGQKNKNGVNGPYNFTAPESLSQGQFSKIAATHLRRPCVMPTPALPIKYLLGEQNDLLLEGQRVVPERLLSQGFEFTFPDLASAIRDLYP